MTREEIFQKILGSITKRKNVRLHLAPRFGKTKLIIELIKRDNPQTILWVTPSRKLAEEDIPGEFEKWGGAEYLDRLEVTTWSSLKKAQGKYDLIVLDEEQFATEINCAQLIKNKLKGKKISMTGTPSTRADKDEILFKVGLRKVAYRLTLEEAVALEIISEFEIVLAVVDLDNRPGTSIDYGDRSEQSVYEMLDQRAKNSYQNGTIPYEVIERANFIKNSLTKLRLAKQILLQYCHGRTLIFSPYIHLAEELCEYSYHSKSKSKEWLEKFQSKEIDRLSLVNSGGVGFTFEGVESVLLMQIDSNKTGLSTQKIARSLLKQGNKTVKIFILVLDDTQDVNWVNTGLSGFDRKRISVMRINLQCGISV